jgi:hypothetical protein
MQQLEQEGVFEGLNDDDKKLMAKEAIEQFFWDKQLKWGGPIPERVLYTESNIHRVIHTTIIEGVDQTYAMIWEKRPNAQEKVVEILNQCAKRYIPKPFAGGILVIYFNICEGFGLA